MIDDEVYRAFEEWFRTDTADDTDFAGDTAQDAINWAEQNGCLDEFLTLPEKGMSLREYLSINFSPLKPNPNFRDRGFKGRRRKGGEHDPIF